MIDEYQTYFVVPMKCNPSTFCHPPPPPPLNSLVSFNTSSRLIYYLPKPPWQKHEDDHYLDIQTDQCKESSCNCRGSRHYQRRHARTAEYRFITPWPATRVTIATEIDKRIRFDNPKVFLVIVQYERKLPHVTPIEWNFVGPRTLDLSAAN